GCDLTAEPDGLGVALMDTSPQGLRWSDGVARLSDTDLSSAGFGMVGGLTRSWSSGPGYVTNGFGGGGTLGGQLPPLRQGPAGTVVALNGTTEVEYFDPGLGGGFLDRAYLTDALSYNSGAGEYTLTDATGGQQVFYDFSSAVPPSQRGQLKRYVDQAGHATSVTWTTGGKPSEVTRSATVGSDT